MKSGNISNVTHTRPSTPRSLFVRICQRTWNEPQTHTGADTNASGSRDERLWEQTRLNLGRRSPTDLEGGLTGLFYNTIMIKENRPKGSVSKLNRAF